MTSELHTLGAAMQQQTELETEKIALGAERRPGLLWTNVHYFADSTPLGLGAVGNQLVDDLVGRCRQPTVAFSSLAYCCRGPDLSVGDAMIWQP